MHEWLNGFETSVTLLLCFFAALIVHELGHYVAARALKLKVLTVTCGYGRLLWAHADRHGTRWECRLWPVSAHVCIADYQTAGFSLGKRFLIVLAGPLANFILPFILFFAFFAMVGQPSVPTIITGVEPGLPAYEAGLRPGDRITSINGQPVRSINDITAFTQRPPEDPLEVAYEREGVSLTTSVLPIWYEYRDMDGVGHAHGRIGLSTRQQPYKLDDIKSVNGASTPTVAEARAALQEQMGQRTVVGLFSQDGNILPSVMDLSAESNRNLNNEKHIEFRRLFPGLMRDNVYLQLDWQQTFLESARRGTEMIGHVALLPFNLFPINRSWITPDAVVSQDASYIQGRLYVFVFFTSLCSCFLGFLNLLPFPRLDGGNMILLAGELWKRRPLQQKEQIRVLVFSLLILYMGVVGANMEDMFRYYLFTVQKAQAQEFPAG